MFSIDFKQQATIVLIILLIILTGFEMFFSYRENKNYYTKRDALNNIYLSSLAVVLNILLRAGTSMSGPSQTSRILQNRNY